MPAVFANPYASRSRYNASQKIAQLRLKNKIQEGRMSVRKLFVLGTSSQVPTRNRNHNGYFVLWDDQGLLFDPGEGTQRQMMLSGIAAGKITKIFITHFHGDHCLGLAGVIQRLSLDRVSHPVEIYYPASGQQYLENLMNATIFHNIAPIIQRPVFEEGVIFLGNTLSVEIRKLDHTVDTIGYRFKESDRVTMIPEKLDKLDLSGPIVGELKKKGKIEHNGKTVHLAEVSTAKPGQSFAFIMDTRFCKAALALARNTDILVCESTYLSEHIEDARRNGHLTAAQAAQIAAEANADTLVLTHFSQRYQSQDAFVSEAGSIHANVIAASDGCQIEFPKRRRTYGQ